MDQIEAPVPAQAESTPPPAPVSAIDHAVATDDFGGFREAKRAELAGKPLPPIEAKTPEPPKQPEPAAPAPQISKRQQQINDYERRIAEQDQRIRALEASLASPAAPRSAAQPGSAPAPTKEAEYKRFLAMPDAPKLEQFESVDEHTAAMSLFIADKRFEERTQQSERAQTEARARETVAKQEDTWNAKKLEVEQVDPGFVDRLRPELKALRPFSWLDEQGNLVQEPRPTAKTAIAQEIVTSPFGVDLLKHLNDHPDEFQRLAAMTPDELYPTLGELRATFKQAAKPAPTKQLTAAPPPPTTLGTKPAVPADAEEAAVASGDQSAFKAERLRKRAAQLR